eukprot:TRINITY_DN15361_c0_g1_i1.p1 TRINITY_DN15361_c0_g1~~TRINITY_DN15361_c0_g1_i1.p1  ORF type:complete len:1247 (+),score=368.65 TRINITY_DN15361_c0_g1_i1:206-3946(+)
MKRSASRSPQASAQAAKRMSGGDRQKIDPAALLAALSAQAAQRSPEPLSLPGAGVVRASHALRACSAADIRRAAAGACNPDGAAASAPAAGGAAAPAGNDGGGRAAPLLSLLSSSPQPAAKSLGEALQMVAAASQDEQGMQKERARPCATKVPLCPVSGAEMEWPPSLAEVLSSVVGELPPVPPSPPASPQAPPPPQPPALEAAVPAAVSGAVAVAAAATPPPEPQTGGKGAGGGKGAAHLIQQLIAVSGGKGLAIKGVKGRGAAAPANLGPPPFKAPDDLGKQLLDAVGGPMRTRLPGHMHAISAMGLMAGGWHDPYEDDLDEDGDTTMAGADEKGGDAGAAAGSPAAGKEGGAAPAAGGKSKKSSEAWRCHECGTTHRSNGQWRWRSKQSQVSLCATCRPAPPDAPDLFVGARVRLRPDARRMRYAWAPPPGDHGVVRYHMNSRVTVTFHRSPGLWHGYRNELDISPEMRFPCDKAEDEGEAKKGTGKGGAKHADPTSGQPAAGKDAGKAGKGDSGEAAQEKEEDVRYEAMDSGGQWWPCTVQARNPDGTVRVLIQDGTEGGVEWPSAQPHLVRTKPGGTAAWQKGTGYSLDDEMDERDLARAERAARERRERQLTSDAVLSQALRAVGQCLREWPRDQASAELDMPVYPQYAALLLGPVPVVMERLLLNDSLHDIAERAEVYHHLLELLGVLAAERPLCELLLLAADGSPPSRTPERLLRTIGEQAKVYMRDASAIERALEQADDETAAVSMAMEFQDALQRLEAAVAEVKKDRVPDGGTPASGTDGAGAAAAADAAEQGDPFEGIRFQMVDMLRGASVYPHTYRNEIQASAHRRPTAQGKRMRQMAALATGCPDGIFVRVDETRQDVIKAMIIGPDDTPYQNGCFVFDIFLPTEYPNEPPKVNMVTTHDQQVRFNPNLYADGKVCLSLLGTWDGPGWNPKESTLLQVLLSIQSMIMVTDPYYNEPGFESDAATPEGRANAQRYTEFIRLFTCKVAILDQMRKPHPDFEEVIKVHFKVRKEAVKKQVEAWLPAEKGGGGPKPEVNQHMGFQDGPFGVGGDPASVKLNFDPSTVRRRVVSALEGAIEPDEAPPEPAAAGGASPPGGSPSSVSPSSGGDLAAVLLAALQSPKPPPAAAPPAGAAQSKAALEEKVKQKEEEKREAFSNKKFDQCKVIQKDIDSLREEMAKLDTAASPPAAASKGDLAAALFACLGPPPGGGGGGGSGGGAGGGGASGGDAGMQVDK